MKRYFLYVLIVAQMVLFFSCVDKGDTRSNADTDTDSGFDKTAPRVIISTDFPPLDVIAGKGAKPGDPPDKLSDPDDVQSMVRFLLYSNEFEVEALIAAAGTFANIARKQNILEMLTFTNKYSPIWQNTIRGTPLQKNYVRLRGRAWMEPSVQKILQEANIDR